MKKIIFILLILFTVVSVEAQKRQIVENPFYESTNTSRLEITRIETSKKETVVSATLWYRHNYWVRLGETMLLKGKETGKEYKMLRVEGIELNKETFMPASNSMDIKIYFEPISSEEKSVDFWEGDSKGSWWINGISLTPSLNTLQGSWAEVGNAGNVLAAFVKDKMLYNGKVWSYTADKKGKNITINITCGGTIRQLYAEQKRDSTLLLKEDKSDKGVLLTRKEQAAGDSDYRFDPNRATPFFFKGGKVVINGALTNRKAGTENENLMKVSFHNNIANIREGSELIKINRDGTFHAEIEVPHPQYIYLQDPINTILFVVPGDTVVVCFDGVEQDREQYKGYAPAVLGNTLSSQLTRYSSVGKKAFEKIEGLKENMNISSKDWANENAVYAYSHKAASLFHAIFEQAPAMLAGYPLSPIAKDIITTNVATDIFVNIMNVTMRCDSAISLPQCYYFLKEDVVRDNLLNNNYLFCSDDNWVLFNRFAFEIFYPYDSNISNDFINQEFRKRPEFTNTNKDRQLDIAEYMLSYGPHYFANYNEKVVEVASAIGYDSIPTKEYIYRNILDKMKERLGIGNCMLFQRSIVECLDKDDVDELMESLAGAMPLFTNPLIAANVLATLRKLVAEKEGGATEKKMLPEVTKFLASLNKKYPGEQIIIDFWGLGCGPCKAGMLYHREFVEKYAGKVRFVYVCDEPSNPEDAVNKFFTENNIKGENVRVSADMWKMLSHDFKFTGIPHLEILLKDGTIMEEGSYYINDDFINTLLDK